MLNTQPELRHSSPKLGFGIDSDQGLSTLEELQLVRLAADLGYKSAWTTSGPNAEAFDRCVIWYRESLLQTGILVVPASGQPPSFYAEHALRAWQSTNGQFVLGVGSGTMESPMHQFPSYIQELRRRLPIDLPLYVGAIGPMMLRVAGKFGDGVALTWTSGRQLARFGSDIILGARSAGRSTPIVAGYIRTVVAEDHIKARRILSASALRYALGLPAYRRHFERLGFADQLHSLETGRTRSPSPAFLKACGAFGRPGEVRRLFYELAEGFDVAIVRVLVDRPGNVESGRMALEECRPA